VCPALGYIGAFGALADGVNVLFLEEVGYLKKILMGGKSNLQPVWLFFGLDL
jgi:hypothetical protein